MSRCRGEFGHRTSIFEGAYRAWSHLGGCDPEKLILDNAVEDLDPITNPHDLNDTRRPLKGSNKNDNSCRQPDVKEIMIDESSSVGNTSPVSCGGGGAPPTSSRTTSTTTTSIEYVHEPLPRRGLDHPFVQSIIAPWLGPHADEEDVENGLYTLRTWWQHRRRGESPSAVKALGTEIMKNLVDGYTIHFFKLALHMVVVDHEPPPKSLVGLLNLDHNLSNEDAVRSKKSSRRSSRTSSGKKIGGSSEQRNAKAGRLVSSMDIDQQPPPSSSTEPKEYGNPNQTPIVYVCTNGNLLIALCIQGITCGVCVKMIEAVLIGVDGTPTIEGILDAVCADELNGAILKISKASEAKRIAHEACALLSLLGYIAVAKEMDAADNIGRKFDTASLITAFDAVVNQDSLDFFNWNYNCYCPDNGVLREDCPR